MKINVVQSAWKRGAYEKRRQPWARVLALALAAAMIMPQSMDAAAAAKKKVKLNKTKVVLKVGKRLR